MELFFHAREKSRECGAVAIFRKLLHPLLVALFLLSTTLPLLADRHKGKEDFGLGLSSVIQAPESEVLEAVDAVVNNGIIQGSKEFNKDQYIEHATSASSSKLFPEWKEPGEVFYKVRTQVVDPRGFYESTDVGTLAVRYVVQSKDAASTIVRLDAVFVEDFRRTVHPSDGSVENAEFKDIQDHVDALEEQKKAAAEGEKNRQQEVARKVLEQKAEMEEVQALSAAQDSEQSLEDRVKELRRKAERLIKAPGAQLRSAPFHSATTLKTLEPGVEVVVLVKTSYWMGVETEDGRHGWIRRDQLEPLP
jgi:DNA-binding PadR family transcriptional regulator